MRQHSAGHLLQSTAAIPLPEKQAASPQFPELCRQRLLCTQDICTFSAANLSANLTAYMTAAELQWNLTDCLDQMNSDQGNPSRPTAF